MAGNMSYISILNWGSGGPSGATSSFSGVAGITFTTTGGTVLASAAGGSGVAQTFSNANGVTFGAAGSVVTASVQTNYQAPGAYLTTAAVVSHTHGVPTLALTNLTGTTASASNGFTLSLSGPAAGGGGAAISAAGGSQSSGTVVFSNSNGVSFGYNAGTITATVTPGAAAGVAAVAAGTQTQTSGTVQFSNGSGVTFGLNAGTLTASVATNYLTTAAQSGHSHGNPSLNLTNLSGTTASNSAGFTLSLSGPAAGAGGGVAAAAGSQTQTSGTVVFSNNSLVSFGMSNSSVVTASIALSILEAGANITLSSSGSTISIIGGAGGSGGGIAAVVGTQTISAGSLVFSNNSMVSFGASNSSISASFNMSQLEAGANITLSTSGSTISIIGAAGGTGGGIALGAGTQTATSGTVVFSNSNGVSFGMNGATVTATVATNYQSQGAYLTTAALSQDSSKYAGTSTGIAGGSVTLNTAGISISLPAYLTTADLSQNTSKYAGTSTGIAGGSVTLNTAGISLSLPAYLTTAAQSGHSHGNPTLNLTNLTGTTASNSAGFTLSLSAAAPGGAGDGYNIIAVSNSTAALSTTVLFSNSGGVSWGLNGGTITATVATNYQSQGAYLTTAALSGDTSKYAGTSTGAAGASVTLNTAGISLSLPAYLTTAALSQNTSNYAGLSTGFAGGSVTLNTAGISVSLPAYLTTAALSTHTHGSAPSITGSISVTSNSSAWSIFIPAFITTAAQSDHSHGNPTLALTNLSGTTASASNGLTISLSAGVGGGGGAVPDRVRKEIIQGERLTTAAALSATQWSNRPIFNPFWMEGTGLVPNTLRFLVSNATSSNRSLGGTFSAALYSQVNATQLTLLTTDTMSFSITNTTQGSAYQGAALMDFTRMSGFTCTAEGRYAVAFAVAPVSANITWMPMSLYGADNFPALSRIYSNNTTGATGANVFPWWGVYTTTTNAMPNSIATNHVAGANSASLADIYAILIEI